MSRLLLVKEFLDGIRVRGLALLNVNLSPFRPPTLGVLFAREPYTFQVIIALVILSAQVVVALRYSISGFFARNRTARVRTLRFHHNLMALYVFCCVRTKCGLLSHT